MSDRRLPKWVGHFIAGAWSAIGLLFLIRNNDASDVFLGAMLVICAVALSAIAETRGR